MYFKVAACTDVGIAKKINQDAVLLKTARTRLGNVCLGVVCDGLGGLRVGELASAEMVRAFSDWFDHILPDLVQKNSITKTKLFEQWKELVSQMNEKILNYASENNICVGTTATALFIVNDSYYIMNIGDCRIYLLTSRIRQLTTDHTLVQYAVEQKKISKEMAKNHPDRNILLQCIGASPYVKPDFFAGKIKKASIFLLCSDGFWHVITEQEMLEAFYSCKAGNKKMPAENLKHLVEASKRRGETDNISAAVIFVAKEEALCLR